MNEDDLDKRDEDSLQSVLQSLMIVLDADGVFLMSTNGHRLSSGCLGTAQFIDMLPDLLAQAMERLSERPPARLGPRLM